MAKEIELTRGYTAIVDDEDFEWLNQYTWNARGREGNIYASRKRRVNEPGQTKHIAMHRFILGIEDPNIHVVHKNGNSLDNRRENLIVYSSDENPRSQSKRNRRTSSKYKGVSWNKYDKKWMAKIQVDGKQYYLGSFLSEREAAKAYNEAASRYFGDLAKLNNIEE